MLGSASRPILIDCEDDRASGLVNADGDTIQETPSHRSLTSVCYGSQTQSSLGPSGFSRTNFGGWKVSIIWRDGGAEINPR